MTLIDTDRFKEIRAHYEHALDSPKGIVLSYPTPKDAESARMRFYTLARMDRKASLDIYPAGHDDRGRSVYDNIVISIHGNILNLKKDIAKPLVEEIS